MPPIMGSAAFLMSDFLGIPYVNIMTAAVIPALMYYITLYFLLDMEAARSGMVGLSAGEIPETLKILRSGILKMIPVVIIVAMLFNRYSPFLA